MSPHDAPAPLHPQDDDALRRVLADVVAPHAAAVDRDATFPQEQLDALAAEGLLALTVPEPSGGRGAGLRAASAVVRELGAVDGSTAMIVTMHYAATAALLAAETDAASETLAAIGAGQHLSTVAFSEFGSRSHFWSPVSTARASDATDGGGDTVVLEARKSWVTSAGHADSYVWSSRPLAEDAPAAGPMTLWLVPTDADGIRVETPFDGLGLRGNASSPVTSDGVRVPRTAMLGSDGAGLDLALSAVLPVFLVLSASMSVGLMRTLAEETATHLQKAQLQHLSQSLAQQAGPRAQLARLQIEADRNRAMLDDTLSAVEQDRADAQLQVLQIKAACGEAAADAADLALRAGGGAAFRKESPVERLFRDSRAARVMAPTTDALHDFVGRALCGLPLLGDLA